MDIDIQTLVKIAAYIGGGMSIGFGAIGAALGEGYAAAEADMAISENPEKSSDIVRNMLVGQAVAESAAIFALVVAILLLFLAPKDPSIVTAAALLSAGACMGLGAFGSGLGSGFPAGQTCYAIVKGCDQEVQNRMTTVMLIGQAVCQTPAILAMVIALMLMFVNVGDTSPVKAMALLSAGLCMGFGAIGSGAGSGLPGGEACRGIGIQPKAQGLLTTNMLIGAAVCQTPAIFAMVIALILLFVNFGDVPFNPYWAAFLGAGLSTGLSAIGSGFGGGMAAGASCEAIARNPRTTAVVTTTMLVGQAVAQSPVIFGLLISFILLFKGYPETVAIAPSAALLAAGICMGLGAIGPGFGSGIVATGAISWVARARDNASLLMRMMLVAQAVAQSTAIYSMVIALVLLFVV
jgi:F-type H+-transporting ATPase subunit c